MLCVTLFSRNFNPGLLPDYHALRGEIFDKIGSTSGLFLALEPKVFVSKIRARIFRTWKAAEEYYGYTLRQAKTVLLRQTPPPVPEIDDEDVGARDGDGSRPRPGQYQIKCDSCSRITPVKIAKDSEPVPRFCICGNLMTVAADGKVTEQKMTELTEAASVEYSMGRYHLFCGEHSFSSRAFLQVDGRLFGVCSVGKHLLYRDRIGIEELEEEHIGD